MPDLWIPGSAEASVDALVAKLHQQIERFAAAQPGKEAEVEIEPEVPGAAAIAPPPEPS